MSTETINNLSANVHRFLQLVIVALLSVVTYFVTDIHSDFKHVKETVQAHDTNLQVLKTQVDFITQSINQNGKKTNP